MFVLDRIEGDWAMVEYGKTMLQLPKTLLPENAKEGDILQIHISVNKEQTNNRKERLEEKARRLFD
ncbi:hypothetical protein HNQ80_002496 [Anaerosolibacter carboniphilus]|uniref:DUF3006 domain-containing protein n=1 Tax=Anaerosolibacter carboniphilus TaxID=1417629 RepID=A0A841KS47_9FIRM|nr:DUF3006 domain-containing protein [Anaerosolibacter carboniphilus]MBB6216396.1 hypothetical protein [Anaerosolibacter carboniphilus]